MNKKRYIFLAIVFSFILFCTYLYAQNDNESAQIDVVKIDNYIINPVTTKFISNAIDNAAKNKATCLIIDIYLPYFVATALFLGGGYLVTQKIRGHL